MKGVLLLLVGLLVGCSTVSEKKLADPQQVWQQRQQALAGLEQWQLNGRLAIDDGVGVYTLNVRWKQKPHSYEIFLSGPLNSGQVQLVGQDTGGVVLRDAKRNVYVAEHPEQLLYQHTGIRMPVTGLRYWILGMPQPSDSSSPASPGAQRKNLQPSEIQLDDEGRLLRFRQHRWQIEYDEYTQVSHWQLPERLSITQDDVEVQLVIHRWRTPS